MSIQKDYQIILKVVADYKEKLAVISVEEWQLAPPIGGWSYSEVYFHIFDSSILTLDALAEAARGNGKVVATPFVSKLILFFGSLPPGKKFQAPKKLAERIKKISREEASLLISQFVTHLDAEMLQMQHANRSVKTKHPRLGYFNAFQWLRFTHIHLSHHLKQLNRIEKSFKFTSLQQ
ncbi:hypothetical protein ACVWYN_000149 [Pedobacter sp. UYP24]